MKKKSVAVFFGGRSPEHEVSIISGIQVLNALNKKKYEVLPVYVTKKGRWILGDGSFYKVDTYKDLKNIEIKGISVQLAPIPGSSCLEERTEKNLLLRALRRFKVDVAFPVFHGRYGEDGGFQALFELVDIPYVGSPVLPSAIGMDKVLSKEIATNLGIPVPKSSWATRSQWRTSKAKTLKSLKNGLSFPVFVKPVRLGSSIGLTKVFQESRLKEAIEVAFFYDTKVMVEESIEKSKEINISLIGRNPYSFSALEEPVSSGDLLSFKDKYLSKEGQSKGMASLKRIIPARIKSTTEKKIKLYAEKFFTEIGGEGVVRIDFLVSADEGKIYFGEANTIPGSLAFYLWRKKGVNFSVLLDKLIKLAEDSHLEKKELTTVFESNILEGFSGAKGSKLQ